MAATPQRAWQPLTPRGVAAFARAPLRRLLLVQFLVAALVAGAVGWFLAEGYFPLVTQAIAKFPATGEMRGRQLHWQGESPVLLAENKFLALSVDLEQSGKVRSVAHVQFEFGRTNWFTRSLLGYAELNYPAGWVVAVNRETLQPLWGAWRPAVLVGAMGLVVLGLLTSWFLLATLYAGPVWLWGFFLNRDLDARGSWRLSGAALLPGALLLVAAISFYALGWMDLVQMAFVYVAHLVLGWLYLVASPFFVQRRASGEKAAKDPFGSKKP